MPGERSVHTRATLEVIEELRGFRKAGKKHPAPGFMQEQLSMRDEARRVRDMSPEARRRWIEEQGMDRGLAVARNLSRGANVPEIPPLGGQQNAL